MEEPVNGNAASATVEDHANAIAAMVDGEEERGSTTAAAAAAAAESEEEPMVGPGPAPRRARRKRPLEFEKAYLDALPSANMCGAPSPLFYSLSLGFLDFWI